MAWLLRTVVAVAAFVAVAWVMHRVMQPAALGYVVDDDAPPPLPPPTPADRLNPDPPPVAAPPQVPAAPKPAPQDSA